MKIKKFHNNRQTSDSTIRLYSTWFEGGKGLCLARIHFFNFRRAERHHLWPAGWVHFFSDH